VNSGEELQHVLHRFPIASGKAFEINFANEQDEQEYMDWLQSSRGSWNPKLRDALEFATLSFRRWKESEPEWPVAGSIHDIKDFKEDNPNADILALVVLRAPWLQDNSFAGLCLFRVTWAKNICIEYLTIHPRLAQKNDKPRGIGTALLHFAAYVAAEIESDMIWGETTQNSVKFYRKLFADTGINDLFLLNKVDYTEFSRRIDSLIAGIE
jgi:hypothetical protein